MSDEMKQENPNYIRAASIIKRLYDNESSHKFIIHLIYSFLPVQLKVSKIFATQKNEKFKCCILGDEIMSVDDQLGIFQSMDTMKMIRSMLDPKLQKEVHTEIRSKVNKREVGFAGSNTSKHLSMSALEALQEFVLNELLQGNREIERITRKMRTENI